ncbi:hypothetical protein CC86DRAFT_421097 [Ophiobolus disseminans]|uniref:Glycosyl transferase family 1 domain-containing protein n=1 Tax=Ophiobolus disseminans TaxID=1469910 RepID=A0A6A6ZTY1_9PLEO|nr:hypothetical protein CC86DRAFT_421097 [Ophiobolus disseminans]
MLPGIIVLNYSYFPETFHSLAKGGATAFAMSAIQVLKQARLFRGIILYKRQEDIQQPTIAMETRNLVLCATISLNFEMQTRLLKDAIATTSDLLACNDTLPPMLYCQTDTLLRYHPDHLPLCVTHHAPFYEDFARHTSDELAGTAFGTDQKAQHLHHSQLQRRYLAKRGIDMAKVFQLCPPIHSMHVADSSETIHTALRDAVSTTPLLLFTAVARIDYFKDVDLLVDAALQLHQQGLPVTVLNSGDEEQDTSRRAKFCGRIPAAHRGHFFIVPKLRKDMLYALFSHCRTKGVFICPSRYETLGITPLEAGLQGVTTLIALIANSRQVEARRSPPERFCFVRMPQNLAVAVRRFEKADLVEKNVSKERFESDFLYAW